MQLPQLPPRGAMQPQFKAAGFNARAGWLEAAVNGALHQLGVAGVTKAGELLSDIGRGPVPNWDAESSKLLSWES